MRESGQRNSRERTVRDILSGREGRPVNADTGAAEYDALPEIQRRLRGIATSESLDGAGLKDCVRRLLVLDLADSSDAFNRRETIKMLSEMEGYKKAPVKVEGGEDNDATDKALAAMMGKV